MYCFVCRGHHLILQMGLFGELAEPAGSRTASFVAGSI